MRLIMKTIACLFLAFSSAYASQTNQGWEFEQTPDGWFLSGGSGFDSGKGNAHNGQGNAWVRQTQGWNAINHFVTISDAPAGAPCAFIAWLRTSDTLTDGYMSVRDGSTNDGTGRIIDEVKLVGARPAGEGNQNGYVRTEVDFNWPASGKVLIYVGLWGIGKDAWIQIDDAGLACNVPNPR